MKKYLLIMAMVVVGVCSAQTPIISLFDTHEYGSVQGAYYKDIYNDMNNYTGTWQYVMGSTSLTIILQKKSQTYSDTSDFYRDMVVGVYKYVENGVEKVNTLNQLITNNPEVYVYHVVGNILNTASHFPLCSECPSHQKRLILSFEDPTREQLGLDGEIVLRRVDENGVQKMELWLRQVGNIITVGDTPAAYTSFSIPWGKYVLTKVN